MAPGLSEHKNGIKFDANAVVECWIEALDNHFFAAVTYNFGTPEPVAVVRALVPCSHAYLHFETFQDDSVEVNVAEMTPRAKFQR